MIRVLEFEDDNGNDPYSKWLFSRCSAALKIRTAIARMESGNFTNVKVVGQGVNEYKLDFWPGYRIYFGKDGDKLVILLGGGAKKRQSRDIEIAQAFWKNYTHRKKKSG